jgi:hypothetical protein
MPPISYSEYKSLVDILDKSGETTYEDLMSKEKNVLNTINHVVKHIQDSDIKSRQFVHTNVSYVAQRFFLIWPEILKDFMKVQTIDDLIICMSKDDRIIYIGLMIILMAFILFLQF